MQIVEEDRVGVHVRLVIRHGILTIHINQSGLQRVQMHLSLIGLQLLEKVSGGEKKQ